MRRGVRAFEIGRDAARGRVPVRRAQAHHCRHQDEAGRVGNGCGQGRGIFNRMRQAQKLAHPLHRRAAHGDVAFKRKVRACRRWTTPRCAPDSFASDTVQASASSAKSRCRTSPSLSRPGSGHGRRARRASRRSSRRSERRQLGNRGACSKIPLEARTAGSAVRGIPKRSQQRESQSSVARLSSAVREALVWSVACSLPAVRL